MSVSSTASNQDAAKVATVPGLRYLTKEGCSTGGICENIFFPDDGLNICEEKERGQDFFTYAVTLQKKPSTTLAETMASDAIEEQRIADFKSKPWTVYRSRYAPEYIDLVDQWILKGSRAVQEARQDAFTPISVEKDAVEKIKNLAVATLGKKYSGISFIDQYSVVKLGLFKGKRQS